MRIQVNRIAHPVTVLGPGRRLGIWVQGCHIGCPGCASVDTWDSGGGRSLDTETLAPELAEIIRSNQLTGITLTGGEPVEQADALADLVSEVRGRVNDPNLDVLMFTGLSAKAAERRAPNLWQVVDAAVCGPYRRDRAGSSPLIASSNQALVVRTELGLHRLANVGVEPSSSLQARVADGDITLVGLPAPGDLPRLEAALLARGVTLGGRSWQTP